MPNAKRHEECLVRLPLWVGLSGKKIKKITDDFYS